MIIRPAKRLEGEITLPGDKSISHRAAIFAALSEGITQIENFSTADDCAATLDCLEKLGVKIERNGTEIVVHGVGKNRFSAPIEPLDCRNSGTTMRLLAGVLAGQNFTSVLTGDESLRKRPMRRVIQPLELMGARIESNDGRAPLTIHGKNPLRAISFEPPVASAQIKSCVLLAGLNSNGETKVLEKTPTRDHTERMFQWLGAQIENKNGEICVSGAAKLGARDINVPSDVSSAAFFLVAAACLKDSNLILKNIGLNPSRNAVVEVLQNFGARIEILNRSETANEPRGDLRILGGKLPKSGSRNLLSGEVIANLIDELPILAVFGTQLENGLEIRDAAELRVKESDRILAVVENLRRMDAGVEEFEDGLRVEKSNLKGAPVDSFGDHRIAMSFAVAGLLAEGETTIENADAVAVSFPNFFDLIESASKS
ncbi:MAG: 3-phosphoshikimate 1-carboxyvinyltransferase [Acidobacteriota bacterium]|nr:3-phosphoshikimate 1-carboxyvinyltransferase [Acidobacteriota bacterium]